MIFLQSKGLSEVFSSITVQRHQFFSTQPFFYCPALTSIHDYWKNHSFDYADLCREWNKNTHIKELSNIAQQKLGLVLRRNAKVGSQETPGVIGKFSLGVQNEAGQRVIEFCQENTLVMANTLFQQHKRRLYTWTSPDGQH